MSNYVISPNMNLRLPIVGQDPDPDWATDLNASLSLVDQHDHTSGNGVQLNQGSINLTGDFPFNNFNATLLRTVRLSATAPSLVAADVRAIYASGGDLYYVNAAATPVQITNGSSIVGSAGSISGLPSGTASASFAAGVFTWNSATSTRANMDMASAILRNNTASSNSLTLSPPAALASSYAIVLPLLPASQKIMSLDASGNMAAPYSVDESTITISSNVIQIKTNANLPGSGVNINSHYPLLMSGASTQTVLIRGRVATDGTRVSGEGFTSAKIGGSGSGTYSVTYTTSFGEQPTVVVNSELLNIFGSYTSGSVSSAGFSFVDSADVTRDTGFSFIAIGIS